MSTDRPTARGDRVQRRIDVVTAAASILEESGWAGLNMREVARRAGVSAGALYQWFAGKDEIYAELYTTRLNEGTAALETLPADLSLEDLMASMFRWVRRTWTDLGRWQVEFSEISRTRDTSDALVALADAHKRLMQSGLRRLADRAVGSGRTLRTDEAAAHLIWATATGVAQRAAVLDLDDGQYDALAELAAASIIAGLTESA
ncbi:MAG: TetR/AcrR family transcriptional regulator [Actinomycetota bacterium]